MVSVCCFVVVTLWRNRVGGLCVAVCLYLFNFYVAIVPNVISSCASFSFYTTACFYSVHVLVYLLERVC